MKGVVLDIRKFEESSLKDDDRDPPDDDANEHVCCTCATHYWIDAELDRFRAKDHKIFYCPMGHGNYYPGPPRAVKLSKWRRVFRMLRKVLKRR